LMHVLKCSNWLSCLMSVVLQSYSIQWLNLGKANL